MQLKPVLRPVQLAFYSVGIIIGTGVYSALARPPDLCNGVRGQALSSQLLWLC
jgi:hypothetical protein